MLFLHTEYLKNTAYICMYTHTHTHTHTHTERVENILSLTPQISIGIGITENYFRHHQLKS